MIKISLKYLLWGGIAGSGTALAVSLYFNGFFAILLLISPISWASGVAGAIMGLVGGGAGYLLGKLANRPKEFGLVAAVIVGGVAGYFAFLFGCGLGC